MDIGSRFTGSQVTRPRLVTVTYELLFILGPINRYEALGEGLQDHLGNFSTDTSVKKMICVRAATGRCSKKVGSATDIQCSRHVEVAVLK